MELVSYLVSYSTTPLIRTLVIRTANYPDQLGPLVKIVENSTKLTCLESTSYRIKYSIVFFVCVIPVACVTNKKGGVVTQHN